MGFFDLLGSGSGRNFYLRDFRNAYKFRPDVNPARQKFQGYVNFIFNRDLYETLYADPSDGSKEFRTTISSLVRTAELPGVNFKTETYNQYNRKKIVNTGVEYTPVGMTVYDTVGNEWLSVLMKYFSYHYMNPRNKSNNGRDIANDILRTGGAENIGSEFLTEVFDSNRAGYNPNLTANFFERIDYVMYHGNKGVQYSIINPVLTSFKPGNLDYSDSSFREFDLSFEYESFTTHDISNFSLTDEDADRFEDASAYQGPAFDAAEELLSLKEQTLGYMSTPRTGQYVPGAIVSTGEADPADGEEGAVPSSVGEENPDALAVQQELSSRNGDIRNTYGVTATFATETEAGESNPFLDLILDTADNAIATAINGGNVKDVALNTALGGLAGIAGNAINNAINNPATPPAEGDDT